VKGFAVRQFITWCGCWTWIKGQHSLDFIALMCFPALNCSVCIMISSLYLLSVVPVEAIIVVRKYWLIARYLINILSEHKTFLLYTFYFFYCCVYSQLYICLLLIIYLFVTVCIVLLLLLLTLTHFYRQCNVMCL